MLQKSLLRLALLLITTLTSQSLFAQQVCPGNLLINPSFENGLNGPSQIQNPQGWTGAGFAEQPANQAQWLLNGNSYGKVVLSGSSLQQDVIASPGMNYVLSFKAGMFEPAINTGTVSIQFFDGVNAPIGAAATHVIAHDINALPGAYNLGNGNSLSLLNSPLNAAYIRVKVSYQNNNLAFSDSVIIDGVCLAASPACNNVIDGGVIGNSELFCGIGFVPATIQNIVSPTGGIGDIEYIWIVSTDGGNNFSVIPGAVDSIYSPTYITQSTWYRRCARRVGCAAYIAESNWLMKKVAPNPIVDAGISLYLGCNAASGVIQASHSQNVVNIQWTPVLGLNSPIITQPLASPVSTTTYTLTVTDNNNCVNSDTVTVFVNNVNVSAPVLTTINSFPLCHGSTLELKATGIVGATFNWTIPQGCSGTIANNISGESTLTIQNMSANCSGMFGVTQSFNNCISPASNINVSVYDSIHTTVTTSDEVCAGSGNGSILVTVTGGSGNNMIGYSLQAACQNGMNGNFQWVTPGTYTVTVVDQACASITHSYVTIVNPGVIVPPPTVPTHIKVCEGDVITLSGTTTLPAKTINWTFGGNMFNAIGNPLVVINATKAMAGCYYAKALDSNGCASIQVPTDIAVYDKPVIDSVAVNCVGASANVVVMALVANGLLQYSLDGITYQNSNEFLNVVAGYYTVYVKNSPSDCEVSAPVYVPNCNCIISPQITFNIPKVSCSLSPIPVSALFTNVNNATLSSSGNGNFSVQSGSSPLTSIYTPSVNDLANGQVTITLLTDDPDGAGPCTAVSKSFAILLRDSLTTPIIIQDKPSYCQGDTVVLQATNVVSPIHWTGVAGYSFSGNPAIIPSANQLAAGNFIAIASGNGCVTKTDTFVLTVNAPPILNVTLQTINETCEGHGNGEITVNVSGGTGLYNACYVKYSNCMMNVGSPINFKWLCAGNYTMYVSDASCPNAWYSYNTTVSDGLHVDMPLTASYNSPVCEGEDLIFTATGLVGDYVWTEYKTGCVFNGISFTRPDAIIQMGGMYKVVRVVNGCASHELMVNAKVFTQPDIISVDTMCTGLDSGTITINAMISPNDTFEYSINNNAYQDMNVFSNLPNGLYDVHVRTKGSDCIETFLNTELFCVVPAGKEIVVSVFPNPNSGIFSVNAILSESSSEVLISVLDMSGRTIYEKTTIAEFGVLKHDININSYATGSYQIRVSIDGEKYVIPITVNR